MPEAFSFQCEMDLDTGEPKDELTQEARDWCKLQGCSANRVSEILDTHDAGVMKAIEEGIARYIKVTLNLAERAKCSLIFTDANDEFVK